MAEVEEKQQVVQQQAGTSAGPGYAPTDPTNAAYGASSATSRRTSVTHRVSGNETIRRIIVLLFAVVQVLILLRFAVLLTNANAGPNALVDGIVSFSRIFVAPFEGIFGAAKSGGSVLETASIVAFIGWTIIEGLVLAILAIVTRKPQGTSY